ncbi:hypothetical protein HK098_007542 [Nowakowskiella sp. JEL0407]|nr:hypothetical protein HK098_007542 [Nowakowskiella sp. JEL0407]
MLLRYAIRKCCPRNLIIIQHAVNYTYRRSLKTFTSLNPPPEESNTPKPSRKVAPAQPEQTLVFEQTLIAENEFGGTMDNYDFSSLYNDEVEEYTQFDNAVDPLLPHQWKDQITNGNLTSADSLITTSATQKAVLAFLRTNKFYDTYTLFQTIGSSTESTKLPQSQSFKITLQSLVSAFLKESNDAEMLIQLFETLVNQFHINVSDSPYISTKVFFSVNIFERVFESRMDYKNLKPLIKYFVALGVKPTQKTLKVITTIADNSADTPLISDLNRLAKTFDFGFYEREVQQKLHLIILREHVRSSKNKFIERVIAEFVKFGGNEKSLIRFRNVTMVFAKYIEKPASLNVRLFPLLVPILVEAFGRVERSDGINPLINFHKLVDLYECFKGDVIPKDEFERIVVKSKKLKEILGLKAEIYDGCVDDISMLVSSTTSARFVNWVDALNLKGQAEDLQFIALLRLVGKEKPMEAVDELGKFLNTHQERTNAAYYNAFMVGVLLSEIGNTEKFKIIKRVLNLMQESNVAMNAVSINVLLRASLKKTRMNGVLQIFEAFAPKLAKLEDRIPTNNLITFLLANCTENGEAKQLIDILSRHNLTMPINKETLGKECKFSQNSISNLLNLPTIANATIAKTITFKDTNPIMNSSPQKYMEMLLLDPTEHQFAPDHFNLTISAILGSAPSLNDRFHYFRPNELQNHKILMRYLILLRHSFSYDLKTAVESIPRIIRTGKYDQVALRHWINICNLLQIDERTLQQEISRQEIRTELTHWINHGIETYHFRKVPLKTAFYKAERYFKIVTKYKLGIQEPEKFITSLAVMIILGYVRAGNGKGVDEVLERYVNNNLFQFSLFLRDRVRVMVALSKIGRVDLGIRFYSEKDNVLINAGERIIYSGITTSMREICGAELSEEVVNDAVEKLWALCCENEKRVKAAGKMVAREVLKYYGKKQDIKKLNSWFGRFMKKGVVDGEIRDLLIDIGFEMRNLEYCKMNFLYMLDKGVSGSMANFGYTDLEAVEIYDKIKHIWARRKLVKLVCVSEEEFPINLWARIVENGNADMITICMVLEAYVWKGDFVRFTQFSGLINESKLADPRGRPVTMHANYVWFVMEMYQILFSKLDEMESPNHDVQKAIRLFWQWFNFVQRITGRSTIAVIEQGPEWSESRMEYFFHDIRPETIEKTVASFVRTMTVCKKMDQLVLLSDLLRQDLNKIDKDASHGPIFTVAIGTEVCKSMAKLGRRESWEWILDTRSWMNKTIEGLRMIGDIKQERKLQKIYWDLLPLEDNLEMKKTHRTLD